VIQVVQLSNLLVDVRFKAVHDFERVKTKI